MNQYVERVYEQYFGDKQENQENKEHKENVEDKGIHCIIHILFKFKFNKKQATSILKVWTFPKINNIHSHTKNKNSV